MRRVVCLGDVMVDVLAQLPGPLAIGSDTPAPITVLDGGSAANVAAWLAEAGVPSTFIGRVGDDEFGRRAVAELQAAGVETAVGVDPLRPTGTCIVLVGPQGERTMVPSAGANDGLAEQAQPAALFGPQGHLHLSGYALFRVGARPAALAALAAAHAAGATISVDAASSAPLRTVGAGRFLGWLPMPLLLFANLHEAAVLTGSTDAQAAARALAARCGEAVVKCGAAGASWSDGSEVVTVPAAAAELVDTTGAGDAFAAGLLAARFGGQQVAASLHAGARLAARALGQVGARPAQVAR